MLVCTVGEQSWQFILDVSGSLLATWLLLRLFPDNSQTNPFPGHGVHFILVCGSAVSFVGVPATTATYGCWTRCVFHGIAVHVEQTPSVAPFASDSLRLAIRVVGVPGIFP